MEEERNVWSVFGVASDDIEERFNSVDENDKDIKCILSDSYFEGITQVYIEIDDRNEAVRIAKRFYGFEDPEVERCE